MTARPGDPNPSSAYERTREPRRIITSITLPTSAALFTEAVSRVPWKGAQRRHADIPRWTEFPRGGHFFPAEEPDLLAEELRPFLRASPAPLATELERPPQGTA